MRAAIVIGMLATTALAGPPKTAVEWLAVGRTYEGKGLHNDAMLAFTEGLKLAPDDVTLEIELGLAAFGAQKYDKAESATLAAIRLAPKPAFHNDPAGRPRGAAFYNLGMIYEALSRKGDAAAAYGESLRARPSRAVREKLSKLDATIGALFDPLAPVRMPGPYASVKDACRDALKRTSQDPDAHWGDHRTCGDPERFPIAAQLGKPYDEVVAFQSNDRVELDFAVRIGTAWFFAIVPEKADRAASHCGGTRFSGITATMVGSRLQLAYASDNQGCQHDGNGHSRSWGWSERGVIVVGVGPLGTPAALPVIPTQVNEWDSYDGDPKETLADIAVTLAWNKDGSLDVAGKVVHKHPLGPDDTDPEELLGRHLLAFP